MEAVMTENYKNFYHLFQMNMLCDVNLVTDDGVQISAHKIILASASSVFLSMFSGTFKESTENKVCIKEVDSEVLKTIVNYAYTLKLDIKEHNVEKLLHAANFYDLNYAKELCYKYIKTNINHKNCVSLMETSKFISNAKIYSFCWLYLLNNFSTILNSDSALANLYEFQFGDIVNLIANDDLVLDFEEKNTCTFHLQGYGLMLLVPWYISTEMCKYFETWWTSQTTQIFDFIIGWITYDTNERSPLLPDLIKYLRLHLISKIGLRRICNEPLVKNNKDLFSNINTEIYVNLRVNSKHRNILGRNLLPNVILAIDGFSNSSYSCVKYMDIRNNDNMKWQSSEHLFFCPPRKDTTMVVSENGVILAIGGHNSYGDHVNCVDELDLKSKKWVPTSQLIQHRKSFAVCTNKQFIYVVGCYDISSEQFLNSVEYYDTNFKIWTEIIEPMPTARDSCSAIINNNKLYVFGGYDFSFLATVEFYDFENKYWKQLDPMPISNSKMGITRNNNVIYLIGGVFGHNRIFKFDLQHFKWDEMLNMHLGRQFAIPNIVIKKNDLLVFMNRGELTCERYDAEKKQWLFVDAEFNINREPSPGYGHIINFNDCILKSYGIHL